MFSITLFIIGICFVFPKLLHWFIGAFSELCVCDSKTYWDIAGIYGDQYGMLNTLFSGLAFAGMITALYLQRQDLQLQREEMRLQRKEMEAATKEQERHRVVFELQQKEVERQRFESSFNSLVGLMYDNKQTVLENGEAGWIALIKLWNSMHNKYYTLKKNSENRKSSCENEIKIYLDACRSWSLSWAMCITNIDSSLLENEKKVLYFSYMEGVLDDKEHDLMRLCIFKSTVSLIIEAREICQKNNLLIRRENGELWLDVCSD